MREYHYPSGRIPHHPSSLRAYSSNLRAKRLAKENRFKAAEYTKKPKKQFTSKLGSADRRLKKLAGKRKLGGVLGALAKKAGAKAKVN